MKLIAFFSAALFAGQAIAIEPAATQFNGYSLTLLVPSADAINLRSIREDARGKADRVCKSVGKTAEAQIVIKEADYRFSIFYLCL